jgi:hypothetical protein
VQFLGIKPGRERARAGKVADKNRHLPALRRAGRYRRFNFDITEGVRSIGA